LAEQKVQVEKILPFPKREIADPDVCNKIDGLWSYDKKFLILSGPPGVGKTRSAEDYVHKKIEQYSPQLSVEQARISKLFPDFRTKVYSSSEISLKLAETGVKFVWDLAVLHPQYSYEDLIRGYKVFSLEKSSTLKVREGLLGFMSRVVAELECLDDDGIPRGTLILDEINRAPIGQLFGEAIYALDRRGTETTTPYELDGHGCAISIPKSLMILGTMNSIDRATSGFDYALRRRFANISVTPSLKAVEEVWSPLDSNISTIGPKLFTIVKTLVLAAEQIGTIPLEELVLGHAYFIPPKVKNDDKLSTIKWLVFSYLYQVFPTLLDYIEQGLLEFKRTEIHKIPMGEALLGELDLYQVDEAQMEFEFLKFFDVEL
jgi:5-methylcytosine-specific restriction endonuclease McrBC GTP-binding regulatory subunit McrB